MFVVPFYLLETAESTAKWLPPPAGGYDGGMEPSALQRQWQYAAKQLSLRVTAPFELQLADGRHVVADVLLEGFGAPQGMLIFADYADIRDKSGAVIAAGYGYSCMVQPRESDIESLEPIRDALEDWGEVK